ncbi:MAG: nitroreductase family protein [Bacteroidia bacterium]|nr:nitroreductase family protein [Bacteroidia bacterium]
MNILSTISNRHSPRSFDKKNVEKEKIELLIEAARWAPSAFNNQPWRFFIAIKSENEEFYNKAIDCLTDFNKLWARSAPVLILTVVKTTYDHNNNVNKYAFHDLGLAIGNMMNQATDMNLFMHQMAGVKFDKMKELLNLPENHEPVSVIAIGYIGKIEDLPVEIQKVENEKKRIRKSFEEILKYSPLN